jgi:hypothetical protein
MKMNKSGKETLCNLCGLSCQLPTGPNDGWVEDYGLIDCRVMGGYSSTPGNGHGALDDCDEYGFSICEFCLDWLFGQFKIPPTVEVSACGDRQTPRVFEKWKSAEQRVKEDDWRGFKEEFFTNKKRHDKARSAR